MPAEGDFGLPPEGSLGLPAEGGFGLPEKRRLGLPAEGGTYPLTIVVKPQGKYFVFILFND